MNMGQRKERKCKKQKQKLRNTIIKIFRSKLLNY